MAIVDDTPWPREDAIAVARAIRSRGIGTIFAARTTESAERLLRERMTVDLSAIDLVRQLENALWFAGNTAAPLFMHYVEGNQGQLAPSQSTMAYMFEGAPRVSVAEGTAPLVAPAMPEGVTTTHAESQRTVKLQPSESLLVSLREERARKGPLMPWWLWTLFGFGAVTLILVLLRSSGGKAWPSAGQPRNGALAVK